MDNFLKKKKCERCGSSLKKGRIMSIYNTECICMNCKKLEQKRSDYKKAVDAEHEEIRKGNYNYKGIDNKKR